MAQHRGARTTDVLLSERKPIDMEPMILDLEATDASLLKFLTRMGKRTSYSAFYNWMTGGIKEILDSVPGGATAGATSITVEHGEYFAVHDIIKVPRTGETMRVTAVTAGSDVLTVARATGTTAAAALNADEEIMLIGNAFPENSVLVPQVTTNEVNNTNVTQTFRHSVAISRRTNDTKLFGGKDRDVERVRILREHMRDINNALWFGEKREADPTQTEGILNFIPDSQKEVIATLTEANFNAHLDASSSRYGSKGAGGTKVAFASRRANGKINGWANGLTRLTPGETKLGVRVRGYTSAHMDVDIVPDEALQGNTYSGYIAILDTAELKKVVFGGMDHKLFTDLQENDRDGTLDEYRSDVGGQWGHPRHHSLITGIQA